MNGILKALSHQKQDQIPCWFMRQAGRFLPEYREIRKDYNILQMFKTPALACDVTLQPLQRFPQIDGAILFADILLIPDAMGLGLYFDEDITEINKIYTVEEILKAVESIIEFL